MSARKTHEPTKLTKEVEETILRHLRAGGFIKHACDAAGIDHRTMRYWLEKGEAGKRPYAAFAKKLLKVRAEDALRSQSVITRAQLGKVEGDWKAAAWSLERKHPKEYGREAMQLAAATSVTLRGAGGAQGNDDGAVTTVQFYLPDNGRRPQDDEDDAGAEEA
jgi:hypothetical protein